MRILQLAQSSISPAQSMRSTTPARCQIFDLRNSIVATKRFGKFWLPFGETARLPTVRELHDTLFEVETSGEMAAMAAFCCDAAGRRCVPGERTRDAGHAAPRV